MRTDATFDRRQVICRNSSMLGYGKVRAQVGDIVIYRDGERITTARMIGRITYAPSCGETRRIKNWILGIAIVSATLDNTHERWINPDDVIQVESLRNQSRVMAYFLSDEIVKAPIDEIRTCSDQGWSTLDAFRAWKLKRDNDIAEYKARKGGQ